MEDANEASGGEEDRDELEKASSDRDPPLGHIRMRPSKFLLHPTVFFEYPSHLGKHSTNCAI